MKGCYQLSRYHYWGWVLSPLKDSLILIPLATLTPSHVCWIVHVCMQALTYTHTCVVGVAFACTRADPGDGLRDRTVNKRQLLGEMGPLSSPRLVMGCSGEAGTASCSWLEVGCPQPCRLPFSGVWMRPAQGPACLRAALLWLLGGPGGTWNISLRPGYGHPQNLWAAHYHS